MSDIVHVCSQVFCTSVDFCAQLFSISFWFNLLLTYKYWVVVLGALVEGEIILMMAAAAAYHGHISIYLVVSFAIVGAIIHDHVLYWVGHKLGNKLRDSRYFAKTEKIRGLIQKYGIYFVATFRFLYGIRTITPILLGATHRFSLKVYCLCVVGSSIVWAFIISYLGYTFALLFEWLTEEFKRVKSFILYSVLCFVLVFVGIYFLKKILKKKN